MQIDIFTQVIVLVVGDLGIFMLGHGAELPWIERGAILALLGSAERAFFLIERIASERRSVSRVVPPTATSEQPREAAGFSPAVVPA